MPEDISSSKAKEENSKLPSHARVVVIGGGVVGCSILYHLTFTWMEGRCSPGKK